MKKIYLIHYDNGEKYPEDYEEFIFTYCYSSEEQANQAINSLMCDTNFLKSINNDIDKINFGIRVVELIDYNNLINLQNFTMRKKIERLEIEKNNLENKLKSLTNNF